MEQLRLPMLTVYTGPRLVSLDVIDACKSYREAVCLCWELRTRRNLTKKLLAETAGLYPSHVTDYLSTKHVKRNLPADKINDFEIACGNRVISQWLARQASLTILEQYLQQPARAVA